MQHDYNIANSDGATVRADLNTLFESIASENSGAVAPTVTFAYMPWFDTTTNLLKKRNAANNAWVIIASLVAGVWTPYLDGLPLGDAATKTVGVAAGNVVMLDAVTAKLPAVDGSLLTGIVAGATAGLNKLINGDFPVWQRGTTFASIAAGAYFADRWLYDKVGAMVHDVSRATNVPTVLQAGRLLNYSALVDCTTIDASIAAGDFCTIGQHIEGFNFLPLAQRSFTIKFAHAHTKTGTHCVAFRNSGTDRSYVAEYTQAVADAWEISTVTVTASPSAGTWDYTTGRGLSVSFALACGSTFQTTANAWNVGNFLATANQVNNCDNVANNFRIAMVQIEVGAVASEFEARPISTEYSLCWRYYSVLGCGLPASADTSGTVVISGGFPAPMRAAPTTALLTAVPSLRFNNSNVAGVGCTILGGFTDKSGFVSIINGFSGLTAGWSGAVNTNDVLSFTAEL